MIKTNTKIFAVVITAIIIALAFSVQSFAAQTYDTDEMTTVSEIGEIEASDYFISESKGPFLLAPGQSRWFSVGTFSSGTRLKTKINWTPSNSYIQICIKYNGATSGTWITLYGGYSEFGTAINQSGSYILCAYNPSDSISLTVSSMSFSTY